MACAARRSSVLRRTLEGAPLGEVHALHEQPETQRQLTDEGRQQNQWEEPRRDVWGEHEREAVGEIRQPGELYQQTQYAGQETGPEDQVSVDEKAEAEHQQRNAVAVGVGPDGEPREHLLLLRGERLQVRRRAEWIERRK